MLLVILSCFVSYVLGSYPTAYFITKLFTRKNVLKNGDKNMGGTNALFLTKSLIAYATVAVFDMLKAFIACALSYYFMKDLWNSTLIAGLFSTIGHNYSMFKSFKGGKGASTNIGVFFFINPSLALIFFLTFLIIVIFNNYVKRVTYNEFKEVVFRTIITTIITYLFFTIYWFHVLSFQLISVLKYLTERQWNKHIKNSFNS